MIVQRYNQLKKLDTVNAQTMSLLYAAYDTQEKKQVVLKLFKGAPKDTTARPQVTPDV